MGNKEIDIKRAIEKRAEETAPFIDFNETEEYSDTYDKQAKQIRSYLHHQMIGKFAELVFGIFCIAMTPFTGPFGCLLFVTALFYLIPDSLVKGSTYFHRVLHYKDYIVSSDYKLEDFYLKVVMDTMRRKGTLA